MTTKRIMVFAVVRTAQADDADYVAACEADAEEVAEKIRQLAVCFFHHADVQITADHAVLVTDESTDKPLFATNSVNAWINDNPDRPFDQYHLIGGRTYNGYGGFGQSDKSVVFSYAARMVLHLHEHNGHAEGIQHMGVIRPNGTVDDYGGYGCSALDGLLPAARAYSNLRLLPDDSIATVNEGEEWTGVLYPIESDPLEVGPHYTLLKLRAGHREYTISFRRWAGGFTHAKSTSLYLDCYYFQNPPQPGATQWIHLDKIQEGEEMDLDGHVVSHEGFEAETVRVVVRPNGQPLQAPPPALELPFQFNQQAQGLAEWAIGNWFHTDFPAQGVDLIVRNGYCTVGWFTYDTGSTPKHARWYFGQGEVSNGRAVLTLFTTRGNRTAVEVGQVAFHAISDTEILMQWLTSEHGRGSCRLRRANTTAGDDIRSGHYLRADLESEGVRAHFTRVAVGGDPNNMVDRVNAWHYGHGAMEPPVAGMPGDPDTSQRWWMFEGDRDGQVYLGSFYEFKEGSFLHPMIPSMHRVKTGALVPMDDGRIRFEVDGWDEAPWSRLTVGRQPH